MVKSQNLPKLIKGNALITALFVMSLVAIVAMAMALRLRLDVKRSDLSLAQSKRIKLFRAQSRLRLVHFMNQNKTTHPESLPATMKVLKLPEGRLSGELTDPEGLFNINSLFAGDPKNFAVLKRLLLLANKDLASDNAEDLLANIMQFTVRHGKLLFVAPSELKPILGEYYTSIEPHLVALPSSKTTLHPYATTPLVLAATYPTLTLDAATNLLRNIEQIDDAQRAQIFLQAGIIVKKENTTPGFLMSKLLFQDRQGRHYLFRKIFQINKNKVKTLSENWFF